MVVGIAKLLEGVAACQAHESLVRSAAGLVTDEDLDEALVFGVVSGNHCVESLVGALVDYF